MTAHGILGLPSPWSRALFPGEARTEAERLIPPLYQINVTAVNGRPGPWRVTGLRIGDGPLEVVLEWTTYSPQNAVRVMAEHLGEMAEVPA